LVPNWLSRSVQRRSKSTRWQCRRHPRELSWPLSCRSRQHCRTCVSGSLAKSMPSRHTTTRLTVFLGFVLFLEFLAVETACERSWSNWAPASTCDKSEHPRRVGQRL